MAIIATLLERRPAVLALRRALGRGARVLAARSPAQLDTLLARHLVDLVVIGAAPARGPVLGALRREYAALPLLLYAPIRSDDADLLLAARRERLVGLAIEGMDDPVLARRVEAHGVTARRLAALLPLAEALDLTDPLQRRSWAAIVREAPAGLDTAALATSLGLSRETLSRRFGAGGAPGLKRAVDAVRLFAAGQLLGNPAFRVEDAARLLGFSSVSLLQRTARRTFGASVREVAVLPESAWAERLRAPGAWR